MLEENKALVRRVLEEITRDGPDAIDRFYSPDVIYHGIQESIGAEAVKELISTYVGAFSDRQMTIEDIIAEGDKVVARFHVEITHTRDLMGIAPTGKRIQIAGIVICRIRDGKIVEEWERVDELGMMQQLGAIPEPG